MKRAIESLRMQHAPRADVKRAFPTHVMKVSSKENISTEIVRRKEKLTQEAKTLLSYA